MCGSAPRLRRPAAIVGASGEAMIRRAVLIVALAAAGACAQSVDSGFVYGGVTVGKHLDGAGRFGVGLDFRISPRFDLGAEVGTVHKNDVGVMASGNVTYHFSRPRPREEWD